MIFNLIKKILLLIKNYLLMFLAILKFIKKVKFLHKTTFSKLNNLNLIIKNKLSLKFYRKIIVEIKMIKNF